MFVGSRGALCAAVVWSLISALSTAETAAVAQGLSEGLSDSLHAGEARSDWIVETGLPLDSERLVSSLELEPSAPAHGDMATLRVRIANRADDAQTFALTASLNRMALFVEASNGAAVVLEDEAPSIREVEWPPLRLPARSIGELTMQILVRRAWSGDLSIDLDGYTFESADTVDLVVHVPEQGMMASARDRADASPGWVRWIWLLAFLPFALLVAWTVARARRPADDPLRRALGRLAASSFGLVLGLVGLSLVSQALASRSSSSSLEETRCEVLDRRLDVEQRALRTDIGREPTTVEAPFPMLALRYEAGGMRRVVEGFAPDVADASREDLARFVPGATVPCWFDADRPERVMVIRGVGTVSTVLIVSLLAAAVVLVWLAWRWPSASVSTSPSPRQVESPGRRSWSSRRSSSGD